MPKDYDCALATDNDHHRVISLYIGKKGFGIVFHCAIEHDPISGTVKEKWYNYCGARNHGKNFIYGGNWITPPEGNPKGGYASMQEALAHAPDELKGWDDFAVRSRLRAIMASLKASATINGAADRELVAALHAGGASCKEVSANRGGLRMAVAQNHAVIAIRALLNCGSELNRSDLARVERALESL